MQPISSVQDKEKIKAALDTISNCFTEMEDERDTVKDVVSDICEEFDLDKKTFRKVARAYHKQNHSEVAQSHEDFEELYKSVVG